MVNCCDIQILLYIWHFPLKKTWILHVELGLRLKFVSYCEVVKGRLSKIKGNMATPDVADTMQCTEGAGRRLGTCICILCIPTWFGSFGCNFLHHLVFLLYEMTHNPTLGLCSNYSRAYKFAFSKQVLQQKWLYSLPSLCLSILFHLHPTSWKFFKVLANGCYPVWGAMAHCYILWGPESLEDGEN